MISWIDMIMFFFFILMSFSTFKEFRNAVNRINHVWRNLIFDPTGISLPDRDSSATIDNVTSRRDIAATWCSLQAHFYLTVRTARVRARPRYADATRPECKRSCVWRRRTQTIVRYRLTGACSLAGHNFYRGVFGDPRCRGTAANGSGQLTRACLEIMHAAKSIQATSVSLRWSLRRALFFFSATEISCNKD